MNEEKLNFSGNENNSPGKQTSIVIPSDLWIQAKQHLIEFRAALIFGINFKIAEKRGFDYPANLLQEKIVRLQEKLKEKCEEVEKLKTVKEAVDKIEHINIELEADEALKDPGVQK